ncbi:DUF1194 domain-containing protein [Aliiroseovarius sediminis]|uniref:DUF1194 domain-containing protein n=1 Tax=Aliiroseovarius sediminis TaxID=2925839 RepID=UPI001F5A0D3C|nr:DUF1194 domain-containing protein [Aliiroseovarius sediminis]MCI2394096.1 DUF1194 domain-containing protein [Aliiroseovarius sediminis]
MARTRLRCLALAALTALWTGDALGQSGATCRQALALGLDVSGSVDAAEYRLQLDGLAAALEQPEVLRALVALPDRPVALAIFEWSGPGHQRLLQDWVHITDRTDVSSVADRLRATRRIKADPSTALGAAMLFGERLLTQRDCWTRTLDISGDGPANSGPRPQDVRQLSNFDRITINGLVIGAGDGETDLAAYYEELVIHGIGRFVEQAVDFKDYENAMARKLLRELMGVVVSDARPDGDQ